MHTILSNPIASIVSSHPTDQLQTKMSACLYTLEDTINDIASATVWPLLSSVKYVILKNANAIVMFFAEMALAPYHQYLEMRMDARDVYSLTWREAICRWVAWTFFNIIPLMWLNVFCPVFMKNIFHAMTGRFLSLLCTVPCLYMKKRGFKGYWYTRHTRQTVKSINNATKVILYMHGGMYYT